MPLLLVLTTLFWGSIFVLAARWMATATSPLAAYAAAATGAVAVAGFFLSLIIVWLAFG